MATDFIKDLKAKGPESVYLFFGDEYLVKEQVQRLVSEVLEPELRSTNFIPFDGTNLDIAALSSQLFTPSLFGGSRVVLVDQTPIFMGKVDRRKLIDKALGSWKGNETKAAFRAFGQLLNVSGLEGEDISTGSQWATELLGAAARADELESLTKLGQAFLAEGVKAQLSTDETALQELVCESFPEGTVLVITAPGVDRRKKLFKEVEQHARVIECSVRQERYGTRMERSFFDERVQEQLSRAGKSIAPGALEKMYNRTGHEMRRLHSELEKLIVYMGERKRATESDVEELFTDYHQAAFYDLANQLRTADLTKILPAVHENLKLADHPLQTLGIVAGEFRKLIVARELLFTVFHASWNPGMPYKAFQPLAKAARTDHPELAVKAKLNLLSMSDYPLYLALKDAQRFPMEKLISIMDAILEADILLKSTRLGGTSPGTIVENLVIKICTIAGEKKTRLGGESR